MNRQERRKQGEKGKAKTYVLNSEQIEQLKKEATEEAIGTAFSLMIGLPVMVIHDKYSQITKKEVDGKCREERFAEMILDLYDSFDKGYLTLNDIKNCVEEETGMKLLPM